jgi:competence protein ComFC
MSQAWLKHNIPKPSTITMVPMHWYRQWRRGYNQAEILAKGLAEKLDIPFTPLLKRHHWTSAQALKNRLQRRENMRNIFTANEKQKSPQGAILLIDDVITTGATLEACSQALIKSGAEKVYILTAARG